MKIKTLEDTLSDRFYCEDTYSCTYVNIICRLYSDTGFDRRCSIAADFATQIICAPIDLSSDIVVGVRRRRARSHRRRRRLQHALYIAARQHATNNTRQGPTDYVGSFPLSPARQPLAWILRKLWQSRRSTETKGCRPTPPSRSIQMVAARTPCSSVELPTSRCSRGAL